MALRLTSGDQLSSRVDGYNTIGGAAFGYFMKIRSERNLMVWKQRIKDANPAALLDYEIKLQNQITKLTKDKATIIGADYEARVKLIQEDRKQRHENWRSLLRSNTQLRVKNADVFGKALDRVADFAKTGIPVGTKATIRETLAMMRNNANELIGLLEKKRQDPESVDDSEIIDQQMAIGQIWRTGLRDAIVIATEEGDIAIEKSYLHAYGEANNFMKDVEDRLGPGSPGAVAIDNLQEFLRGGVNLAANQNAKEDVFEEYRAGEHLYGQTMREKQKLLDVASAAGLGIKRLTKEDLDSMLGTSSTAIIDSSITKLQKRLDNLDVRREEKEAEYEYLLRGGGMHMGIDPISYRPSRVGSRMEALQRMYEAEPSLAEATDRSGDVTYGTGAGGNLSEFLKARIGEYEDMVSSGADPVRIMDMVVKAVDLYGDTLEDADVTFDAPVSIRGQQMTNIKDAVASYKATKEQQADNFRKENRTEPPDYQERLAGYYLASISGEKTDLTRDYGGPQRVADREGDPGGASVDEYHSMLYPARSNVSAVLNPYIEKIRDARNEDDKEGIYNAMRDLRNVVEDPDLDDLLGSAGTNIRGALDGLHSSAEQIGAKAALERTSRHILKQYEDLAAQRVEQDPGLFVAQGGE